MMPNTQADILSTSAHSQTETASTTITGAKQYLQKKSHNHPSNLSDYIVSRNEKYHKDVTGVNTPDLESRKLLQYQILLLPDGIDRMAYLLCVRIVDSTCGVDSAGNLICVVAGSAKQ